MNTNQTATALLSLVTPMIRGLALRFKARSGGSVEAADLVQVGLMAALNCAQTFDPEAGASFLTYCRHPVCAAMKRARNASQSLMGARTHCSARDISFSAPAHTDSETETFGDTVADPSESVEEQAMKAEREAKVRAIVAKVRSAHKNKALFDDLLERLMASHFGGEGERLRSEIPLSDIAKKHGMTRQGADVNSKAILRNLTRALSVIARED